MKRFAILAVTALAACATSTASGITASPQLVAQAKNAISDASRDASSLQFKDWRAYQISNGEKAVCVLANGTNGFGGYTGFAPVLVTFTAAGPLVWEAGPAMMECNALAAGRSNRL